MRYTINDANNHSILTIDGPCCICNGIYSCGCENKYSVSCIIRIINEFIDLLVVNRYGPDHGNWSYLQEVSRKHENFSSEPGCFHN